MNRYKEIVSTGLIIFLLIIILFIMFFLNNYDKNNYNKEEKISEIKILSEDEIMEIAKTDLEILRLISREVQIIEGPRLVNQTDRNNIPSIYPDYEPLYLIVFNKLEYDLYVVINQTSVINKIPLSSFG